MGKSKFPEYEFHEYANIFPMMKGDEFVAFADDIEANGLSEPIIVYKSQILDGRNRYESCRQKGIKPRFENFKGDDGAALRFVLSRNLHRRHLTPSQYAMIGAELRKQIGEHTEAIRNEKLKTGENPANSPLMQHCTNGEGRTSAELASEAIGGAASARSINKASDVLEQGSSALVDAVKSGDVTVDDAKKVLDLPKADQTAAVKAVKEGKAKTVAAAAKAEEPEEEQEIQDQVGNVVPTEVYEAFVDGKELRQLAKDQTTLKNKFSKLCEGPAGQFFAAISQEMAKEMKSLSERIRSNAPYAVCPYCKGKAHGCKRCKASGYMSVAVYETTPEQAKK